MKPFITVDLTIEDVIEGKDESKYIGMMGAILCSGSDQDKRIEVKVGTGFDDQQRKEYWSRREELIGRTVEIRGDALTLSQNSTDVYSLRFPSFLGFRNDK
jgi:ATP-dependent DNA ligase